MEHDQKLVESLGNRLKALPDLNAPDTLISRVQAAIQARAALQWWQRPWNQWPQHVQLASCGWLAVVGAVLYWGVIGWDRVPELGATSNSSNSFGLVTTLWDFAMSLLQTVGTVLGAFKLFLIVGAVLLFVFYLACLGIGTACLRTSLQKRETP
jgi:hypothetical protein